MFLNDFQREESGKHSLRPQPQPQVHDKWKDSINKTQDATEQCFPSTLAISDFYMGKMNRNEKNKDKI